MNNFDEWSQIISRFLKAEADLLTSVTKHEIAADSTRAAFIRGVLEPFLPSSYAIGSGRIIDSAGQSSDHIDIVIYRRDFPRLNLPGSSDVFLYESVLATIEVRTKLIRKTLFDALDTCASIAKLNPDISKQVLKNIATQNKLTLNDQNMYVHEHPLLTHRFNLIGRPPSFIYGFSGFQTSPSQLNDNVKIWLEQRQKADLDTDLNSFPAVIATQGCIGWRNAAPLSANNNHLFGIGADTAPIRLIVFQLLYQLNRRLKVTPDGYGLKPSVDSYLKQMAPPEIQHTVGKATNTMRIAPKAQKAGSETEKSKAPIKAKNHISRSRPATASKPVIEAKPVPESKATPEPKPVIETKPVVEPKPAPETKPTIESKPVPETRPVVESKPAPEPKAVTQPKSVTKSKPASEPESVFDSKPVFETSSIAKPDSRPEAKAAPESEASATPKPALGALYHPDPTLAEMPIPDASLIPEHESEPEPESDSFIATTPVSKSVSNPDSEPTVPAIEKVSDPEAESDPFIQTMRIPPSGSKSTSEPPKPAVEEKSDSESDPFLQTVRIPAPIPESKSDPFGKTIPGLQDPPKSVH
jgi:hypothetical protein